MVSWCRGLSLQNLKAAREEKAEGQPRVVSPRPFKLLVGERQTRLPLALQGETIPRRAQALGSRTASAGRAAALPARACDLGGSGAWGPDTGLFLAPGFCRARHFL